MANPFLMTDDDLPQENEPVVNPFLMQADADADDGAETDTTDNPFFADAKNPFADFGADDAGAVDGSDEQPNNIFDASGGDGSNNEILHPAEIDDIHAQHAKPVNIDSAMSFFGTTISDEDEHDHEMQGLAKPIDLNIQHVDASDDDEVNHHILPPPRPVPPSRTTQDLILSVSDQLDQTSSHMLDRIPVTRTPSPVSMRDLHTPSPTADLLDVSDGTEAFGDHSAAQLPQTADNIFGLVDDNPFASVIDTTPTSAVAPAAVAKAEAVRPPPPRPTPPRPSPPRRPSPPQMPAAPVVASVAQPPPPPRPAPPPVPQPVAVAPAAVPSEPDLFDMFGSSDIPAQPKKPPPPKSKEDILSLFSISSTASTSVPPTSTMANDLLSGDIMSMDNNDLPSAQSANVIMSSMQQPPGGGYSPPTSIAATVPPSAAAAPIPQNDRTSAEASDTDALDNVSSVSPVISDIHTMTDTTPPGVEKENNILDDADTISPSGVSTVESVHSEYVNPQQQQDDHMPQYQQSESHYPSFVDVTAAPPSDVSDSEHMDTAMDFTAITPTPSVNPFASPEAEPAEDFTTTDDAYVTPIAPPVVVPQVALTFSVEPPAADEFDAFAAKFDSVKKEENNLLDGFGPPSRSVSSEFAWGNEESAAAAFGDESAVGSSGFGADEDEGGFDSFLAMSAPPPALDRDSDDDGAGKEFSVVIRPRDVGPHDGGALGSVLAPPPRGSHNNSMYSGDSSPRVNPFDKGDDDDAAVAVRAPGAAVPASFPAELDTAVPHMPARTDSQETPPTPLFDEDVSQPLEDFPRITYVGDGWEMQLRQPNKKKITGQRFWKKIWLRIINPHENPVIQLRNAATDKEPFQELPLQACYSVSDISAQQFDQFGKIFTVKLQYIFYKERPGVRPGQVTKAERLTTKLSQFAAFAIQGDYQGVKEFGSDLKKLGLPVEHAPQVSQLFKIGSHNYEDMKQFLVYVDELLFKYNVHRDRALTYKMEEVQVTAVDELYVEQTADGLVMKQICRVRLFFLGFLSGMPTIELGVNDLWRQGKEVVGRHDIIPVVTEEWIRLEGVEFHSCVQQNEYERSRTIRFQPPDACYIELMRFRVRPPKNRELPFQLKASWCVTGNKVELRADVLVPGFASRKLGQIPCEDVSIRFPIPECWIYLFRVEKHFRYGSVKSAHRRTGKIKGIERILGTVDQLQESLIEVTSGQAKYEHHHRAIVWRCPRLPKEGQGAYTTHQLVVRMALTSYDQIPEQLAPYCYVEFTMPATQVSHMTVRSVSVQDSDSDDPPEKYVRYLARHEYRVGIEHTTGESMNPYLAATSTRKAEPPKAEAPAASMPAIAGSDSDSDSN